MKTKIFSRLVMFSFIFLISCGYETWVVNTVHKDGSITRTITMKNNEDGEFLPKKYKVPVDSTWTTEYNMEIEEEDTTWILSAKKHFTNVEEINAEYRVDSGSNGNIPRTAEFSKKFKWFYTVYRFSERIDRSMSIPSPMSEVLSSKELEFAYLPNKVQEELKEGPDSTRYKTLSDSVDTKAEYWLSLSLVRQWIEIFYDLFDDHPSLDITKEEMKLKETELAKLFDILDETETFDTVFGKQFYKTLKTEVDSSINVLYEVLDTFINMEEYHMEIRMPGKILASSGYLKPGEEELQEGIIWTVKSDFFLGEDYVMWVESQTVNLWAWILSGAFILFVFAGLLSRKMKGYS